MAAVDARRGVLPDYQLPEEVFVPLPSKVSAIVDYARASQWSRVTALLSGPCAAAISGDQLGSVLDLAVKTDSQWKVQEVILKAPHAEAISAHHLGAAFLVAADAVQCELMHLILINLSSKPLREKCLVEVSQRSMDTGRWNFIDWIISTPYMEEIPDEFLGLIMAHAAESEQEGVVRAILPRLFEKPPLALHMSHALIAAARAGQWQWILDLLAVPCVGSCSWATMWSLADFAAVKEQWAVVEKIMDKVPSERNVYMGPLLVNTACAGQWELTQKIVEKTGMRNFPGKHLGAALIAATKAGKWQLASELLLLRPYDGFSSVGLNLSLPIAAEEKQWRVVYQMLTVRRSHSLDGRPLSGVLVMATEDSQWKIVNETLKVRRGSPLSKESLEFVLVAAAKEERWEIVRRILFPAPDLRTFSLLSLGFVLQFAEAREEQSIAAFLRRHLTPLIIPLGFVNGT